MRGGSLAEPSFTQLDPSQNLTILFSGEFCVRWLHYIADRMDTYNKSRIKEYEALFVQAPHRFALRAAQPSRAVLARNNAVYYYRVGTLLLAVVFLAVAPCGCP